MAFVLPPFLASIGMSFFRIELLRDDFTPFVGLRNYATRLPADTEFLGTLPLTLLFAALTSALAVPLALATALLITAGRRFAGVLAVVLLLPWAIAPIADGLRGGHVRAEDRDRHVPHDPGRRCRPVGHP